MDNLSDIAKLFALNLPAAAAAWVASGLLTGNRRGPERLLAACVVFVSTVAFTLLLLSMAGAIKYPNAFAAQVVILAVVVAAARVKSKSSRAVYSPDVLSYGEASNSEPDAMAGAAMAAVKVISAVLFLMMCSFALTMPPAPTDAFLDHLVFPAEWLRAGKIVFVQTLSPEQATTYYPGNGELMYLWLMLPLNDDLLCGLMESASLLTALLAACVIGLRAGMPPKSAATAAAAGAAVPIVLAQTLQFGIDLYFTAFFLTAVAFLIPRSDGARAKGDMLMAGLAAGLAVGSKYFGAVMLALLVPLVVARARGESWKKVLSRADAFFAAAAAAGIFWYARNLSLTGSPFYPMGLDIFGWKIFEGAFERAAMFRSYLHIPASDMGAFGKIVVGRALGGGAAAVLFGAALIAGALKAAPGRATAARAAAFAAAVGATAAQARHPGFLPASAASALPLISGALFFSLMSAALKTRRAPHVRLVIALVPAVFLLFWHVNPYNIENNARFLAPGLMLAAIGIGIAMWKGKWERGWWAVAGALALGNVGAATRFGAFARDAFFGGAGMPEWVSNAAPALALFAVAALAGSAAFFAPAGRKPARAIVPALVAAAALHFALPYKSGHMERFRYDWYGAHYLASGWRALNSIDSALTVAYSGNCSPYGLYGHKLKNRVIYANVDGRQGAVFHHYEKDLRSFPGYKPPLESVWLNHIFRGYPDFDAWLAVLIKEDVDVLFLTREFARGRVETPVEAYWAAENPDLFHPYFIQGDTFIFVINKSRFKPDSPEPFEQETETPDASETAE
ncbi:MAG TPA: hypothetical protein PKH33_15025 [bacterium]|nr:hypothetical protein [bacterium]